ncbi:hypothetical protein [Cystobacter fuscus]|uniref:SitA5 family polymorphic toxin n=1 Tax=Cystobacter fuscus TaxID=43 RepID=UPI002B2C1A99|nr:hypothetical protein F0U63_14465 [Cystobacter fuscus]
MKLSFIAVWLLLLVGCGTASRVVHLNTGETHPLTFVPRSRARPVRLEPEEFKAAMAARAREVRHPTHVQESARRLFEMDARTGSFEYDGHTRRLSAALAPGNTLEEEPSRGEAELTRDYLRWCARTGRPGDCLHLLEKGSTLNGDGRYTLAMALAKGVVLDEMLEAFKNMADPHAMVSAILWTCTTYMLLLTVPEPVSKGIAAVMTATLIAYVGVDTFWGLLLGFKRLVLEADRATTFHELRETGERYGKSMGRNAARAFAMLAMAAIGNTAPGLAAKVPKLPGAQHAAVQAEMQVGIRLAAVGEVKTVAVSAESVTIALTPGAVAMMGRGRQTSSNPSQSLKSLQAQLAEHRQKLADYKANPDAFDNQGILRKAPSPEVRQRIINGRIKHLEDEIRAFEKNIRDLGGAP